MKVLIATGIYPPLIGGPAQYAKNVKSEWEKKGHTVKVKTFNTERYLPSGIRHFYYFIKIIPAVFWCDYILALDTFSVGWPATCAAKIFRKKISIRIGGDFLWEGYTERTKELVLLKDFYQTTRNSWSLKEKIIFKITKWALHRTGALIFSTKWQRDIWLEPYRLENVKIFFVENFYGGKEESFSPSHKNFVGSTRPLVWKNTDLIKKVFSSKEAIDSGATYEIDVYPHDKFMQVVSHTYALILVSLGDVSPNMILDAIRYNKPFILTKENGLVDRIGEISLLVDPKDPEDIKEKVLWLSNENNYKSQVEKIKNFDFTHTWPEIADEIIKIWEKI